jgi:hypothetical protein
MLTSKIANRLDSNDADWKHLKKHIESNIESLNRFDDVDFTDKEAAAILCQGRQEAVRILQVILEPFGQPEESTSDAGKHVGEKTGVLL